MVRIERVMDSSLADNIGIKAGDILLLDNVRF